MKDDELLESDNDLGRCHTCCSEDLSNTLVSNRYIYVIFFQIQSSFKASLSIIGKRSVKDDKIL